MVNNISNTTSDDIASALKVFVPLISEIAEYANRRDYENVKIKLRELFGKEECQKLFTHYDFAKFTLGYFKGVAPEAAKVMLENETAKQYLQNDMQKALQKAKVAKVED